MPRRAKKSNAKSEQNVNRLSTRSGKILIGHVTFEFGGRGSQCYLGILLFSGSMLQTKRV